MPQQSEFQKFGSAFQQKLCQLILDEREFADQMFEVLNISYLELKYLQVFVKKIFEYRQDYKVHPSRETMMMVLRSGLDKEDEVVQKQTRDYFARLPDSVEDAEYVKNTALNFCKKQKLKEAMIKSVDIIENTANVPFDEVAKTLNDALKAGTNTNLGHDFIKDFEARYQMKVRSPISMGWEEMDKITSGGLGRGELGIVIASTGAGKSMAMVAIGANALSAGLKVLYITLELSAEVIGLRFDSALTGFKLGELKSFKNEVFDQISKCDGQLKIKEYPARSASLVTIHNHIDKLIRSGWKPDLVIVDYGDLLKPVGIAQRELRHDLESIFTGMRGLAQEFNSAFLSASQVNRAGAANMELVTMEHISEAYSKCFNADFIFAITRTLRDRQNNTGKMFIAKNRNGPDSIIFPILMNTADVSITVLPSAGDTPEDIKEQSMADHQQSLKEKYKKFKDKKEN